MISTYVFVVVVVANRMFQANQVGVYMAEKKVGGGAGSLSVDSDRSRGGMAVYVLITDGDDKEKIYSDNSLSWARNTSSSSSTSSRSSSWDSEGHLRLGSQTRLLQVVDWDVQVALDYADRQYQGSVSEHAKGGEERFFLQGNGMFGEGATHW